MMGIWQGRSRTAGKASITRQAQRRVGVQVALAIVVGLVGLHGLPRPTRAEPSPPASQADLDEATRLDQDVENLYQRGKFQEAVPLAERSLELREKALGSAHPLIADSTNNLGLLYQAQGAYARAEPLLARTLAIREKALGAMHLDVATSLENLAMIYRAQASYALAKPLLVQALTIREKALGVTHPLVADSLNNLGLLYREQGTYAQAKPLLVRALTIREKALGAMHPDVASSLENLAVFYQDQNAYAQAEPLFVRALAISEKALGAMHPEVATSLNNLAALYQSQGAYTRAEPLYVRALAIRKQALGVRHPDTAISLNNLATLYQAQGAYTRAEPLLVQALAITEQTLGATHPDVATSLNNLALLYRAQGAYAQSEPLLVQALAIWEKALGAMHPDVAQGLNNLASIHFAQGAYTRAESLYSRALDICEKALGPQHPVVAQILNNLASVYEIQGDYKRAKPLLLRALSLREKSLGATHPGVARSLNNLAVFYRAQGEYARAESLYIRAFTIQEKTLGAMHLDTSTTLNNLALLYRAQGAYARPSPLLIRALAIREKVLGARHPDVAISLSNLASIYEAQGEYARAEPLFARAAEAQESNLRVELAPLSESRKRDLMQHLYGEMERVVSFHAHAVPTSAPALDLALTAVLQHKGRVLDSLIANQAALRAHLTPQLRAKLDELADARSELSTRLRAPYDPRTAPDRTAALAALRSRIDGLEAELNAASVEYRVQSAPVTVAKVQAALPRGAALVEFVRYNRCDPRQPKPWQEAHYLAYLMPWQGPPGWVPLGDAAAIDARVNAALATMHKGASADAARAALRSLDAAVLAPIRNRLSGVSHLILSPDGKLNLVPFEGLIDPQGRYALERWLISYVTSGRDLLRLEARPAPRSPALIVADPDYGPGKLFTPLAGTRAEADQIAVHLRDARTLTGARATKEALADVVGPAVLHVATHGFYARGVATPAASAAPAAPERGMSIDATAALPPPAEDPIDALDRAGLALAGANSRPEGIVSAREFASYDWWGTQLVVLSACETGVGEVPSGEGVYGLRRALVLAGAQSQIVSLWNVSDSSARALMAALYTALARGTGRAQALRQAKLALLHQPRFAHPYYWAAFIAAGDWTPLDPDTLRQAR